MGMFDSFYFENENILPYNAEDSKYEFQTKDLECKLHVYKVDKDGNVAKFELNYDGGRSEIDEPINDAAYIHSWNFDVDPIRKQTYKIIILDSKLVYIERIEEQNED